MSYCRIHDTNNCLECVVERQTRALIDEIRALRKPMVRPPVRARLMAWIRGQAKRFKAQTK